MEKNLLGTSEAFSGSAKPILAAIGKDVFKFPPPVALLFGSLALESSHAEIYWILLVCTQLQSKAVPGHLERVGSAQPLMQFILPPQHRGRPHPPPHAPTLQQLLPPARHCSRSAS